ncbi:hypothetical protein ABPG77_004003 [Micractinium sp. CCAP 211/92]
MQATSSPSSCYTPALGRHGPRRVQPASSRVHARRASRLAVRAEADAEPTTAATSTEASTHANDHSTAPAAPEQQPAAAEQQVESKAADWELPEVELAYREPSGGQKAWTSVKLAFALPWRRFKSESVLTLKLSGEIAEQPQGRFSKTISLPALCECLQKAALDPRVVGVCVKVEPLACGWGKLQELRRHIEAFKQSGKFSMAYLERGGEKEYFLASCFGEVYIPPSANLSLRGLSVSGTFLREALEKVGVEPEVRRIGVYKSAGDQLLRTDMSEAQREQLTALLDDIYGGFLEHVASARGKTKEEVAAFLDEGVFDMEVFKQRGFVDDLKYECEIEEVLKKRTGGKEDELRKVGYNKYKSVSPSAFGLSGRKAIAVVRAAGAITGSSGGTGSSITSSQVIAQLRGLKKNKNIAAVVLRIDSPGGDALASDLMWREIRELSKTKPVIASMSDVAASGGFYMAMAAQKVVAEALTITGSIGVVTGKFNLQDLYRRVGYGKEVLSRGKYAQLLAENKAFTPEEEALFDAAAQHAYESFRNKAAESRGMSVEAMQEVAQGRVWSGQRAVQIGLVDHVGGLWRAIQLAKREAGLAPDEAPRVLEVSKAQTSPLQLVGGGASGPAALGLLLLQALAGGSPAQGAQSLAASVGAPALLQALAASLGGSAAGSAAAAAASAAQTMEGLADGRVLAAMPEIAVEGVASQALLRQGGMGGDSSSGGGLFDD